MTEQSLPAGYSEGSMMFVLLDLSSLLLSLLLDESLAKNRFKLVVVALDMLEDVDVAILVVAGVLMVEKAFPF